YRAVGLSVLRAGGDPSDPEAATRAARNLDLDLLDDPAIREEAAGDAASKVAAIPAVRAALLDLQRDFAEHPPGNAAGAVLDGRDIGTVVCPDADVKLFVTADTETRARRRWLELKARGEDVPFETVLAEMEARDARDRSRSHAPLVAAKDAHLLDTTNSDIETVFQTALTLVKERIA
ncbi:MAG: (d)CMP kinase, partial [Alphaproteobacteria bacterium]